MKFLDVIGFSLDNMRGRKLRSWLTVLGIVIAVAAIVVLISLANGVDAQISSRLNTLGSDIVQITPGASRSTITRVGGPGIEIPGGGGGFDRGAAFGGFGRINGRLTFQDANQLKSVDGVSIVDVRLQGSKRATYKGKNASLQITGIDPQAFNAIANPVMYQGKTLNPSDRNSVILGYRIYSSTFAGEELINRQIKIGDSYYRIVGLINQTSGSQVVSDNTAYMPLEAAKQLLNESTDANQIFVKVAKGRDTDVVAASIVERLDDVHRLQAGKEDFTVTTASFIQSTASSIADTLTLFLGGIAAISLLVGAIGVANTMFMSVLERTKEIGILKALGMKDSEITAMFLIEAAAIGILGGVIGVALSLVISYILKTMNVPTLITMDLVLGAVIFSAIIGVVSGTIPARNASKLQPVEALRYE
jgi:putative ABC transport system permease protein